MYLTSLTRRESLFELSSRWFRDQPEEADGTFLTQLSIYESIITAPLVLDLLVSIHQKLYGHTVRLFRLRTKDQLREAILRSCSNPTPREIELFSRYREFPEEFFPRTPGDMVLGLGEDGSVIGIARVKRLKRIAEKCSRRVTQLLDARIKESARHHADRRAANHAIALHQLLSSDSEMAEDFYAAERQVAKNIQEGAIQFSPEDLRIDDVIGIKFVCRPDEMSKIENEINHHHSVLNVRRKIHKGSYNDVNLVVEIKMPSHGSIVEREMQRDWSKCPRRGLDPETLERGFSDYVHKGAESFCVEVILTTHGDLVESEFGSSIHESRIIEQRNNLRTGGRIASNASFLIEYMLMLPLSPSVTIRELPIKMWGRYLPDVYSIAIWDIFGHSVGRDQIDSMFPEKDVEIMK